MQLSPTKSDPITAGELNVNFADAARRLFKQFHLLAKGHTRTAKLAQQIYEIVASSNRDIAIMNHCPHTPPFTISDITKSIDDTLSSFFIKASPQVTTIALVFKRNFRLFTRQYSKENKSFSVYETTRTSVEKINPDLISRKKIDGLRKGYIIFISHNRIHKLKPVPTPDTNEPQGYYHFRPRLAEASKLRKAPFHHEIQLENQCGLHAINAYIGCRYFSQAKINEYYQKWSIMRRTSSEKLNKPSDDTLGKRLSEAASDKSSDKSCEKSCEKLSGVDPAFILFLLRNEVSAPTKHITRYIHSKRDSQMMIDVANDLKNVDRFIIGVTSCRGHLLTYRKDDNGLWWRVDSDKDEQDSFENIQEVLDDIESKASNYPLHFIYPDSPVTFKFE